MFGLWAMGTENNVLFHKVCELGPMVTGSRCGGSGNEGAGMPSAHGALLSACFT